MQKKASFNVGPHLSRVASVSTPGVHYGNDFLRTEEEMDSLNRRGGLDAVSLLRHIPQEKVKELGVVWGDRKLVKSQFIELLLPIVWDSGFFDSSGSRIQQKWRAEGWLNFAVKACNELRVEQRQRKGEFFEVHNIGGEEVELSTTSDIILYLTDVFSYVDCHRKGKATWENFTVYLIDGIAGITTTGNSAAVNDEQPIGYDFRGEVPVFTEKFQPTTSHEWYSRLRYYPEIDRVMCMSRQKVTFVHPNQQSQLASSGVKCTMEHDGFVVAAEYMPCYEATLTWTTDSICPVHVWQHAPTGVAREVLATSLDLPKRTIATTLLWTPERQRLWFGTRKGILYTTDISKEELYYRYTFSPVTKLAASHADIVTTIFPIPTSTHVVTGSMDTTMRIFDCTGSSIATLAGHDHGITCGSFVPDFHVILSAGFDSMVHVWADNLWRAPVMSLQDPQLPFLGPVIAVKGIPSTSHVAVADSSGMLKMFDLRTRGVLFTLNVSDPENFVAGLVKREHLRSDLLLDKGSTVNWNIVKNPEARKSHLFSSMEFTGSVHRQFFIGGSRVYYYGMAAEIQENPFLTCNADSGIILATSHRLLGLVTVSNEEIVSWSMTTGLPDTRVVRLTSSQVTAVVLRPQTDIVILGHADGTVSTHQASTGLCLQQYLCHEGKVCSICCHPLLPAIISCSGEDKKIVLWFDELLFAVKAIPEVQPVARRIIPTQCLTFSVPPLDVLFHEDGQLLLVIMAHSVQFLAFNEVYKRWVGVLKLRQGNIAEIQQVKFLPMPYGKSKQLDEIIYRILIGDNRGRFFMWELNLDEMDATMTCRLLHLWANISVFDRQHRIRQVVKNTTGQSEANPKTATGHRRDELEIMAATHAVPEGAEEIEPELLEILENSCGQDDLLAPPLRCFFFDPVMPYLLFSGDDLGGISIWLFNNFLRHYVYGEPVSTVDQPYCLSTFAVHDQPITSMESSTLMKNVIISTGQDNMVYLSTWYGHVLAKLQQGPLVERTWSLKKELRSAPMSNLAHLRWMKLRMYFVEGRFSHWENKDEEQQDLSDEVAPLGGLHNEKSTNSMFEVDARVSFVEVPRFKEVSFCPPPAVEKQRSLSTAPGRTSLVQNRNMSLEWSRAMSISTCCSSPEYQRTKKQHTVNMPRQLMPLPVQTATSALVDEANKGHLQEDVAFVRKKKDSLAEQEKQKERDEEEKDEPCILRGLRGGIVASPRSKQILEGLTSSPVDDDLPPLVKMRAKLKKPTHVLRNSPRTPQPTVEWEGEDSDDGQPQFLTSEAKLHRRWQSGAEKHGIFRKTEEKKRKH